MLQHYEMMITQLSFHLLLILAKHRELNQSSNFPMWDFTSSTYISEETRMFNRPHKGLICFPHWKKNPKERGREKHSAHLYHHRMIREGSKSGCVTTYMIDITVVTRPKISLKEDMVFRLCNILVLLQLCSSGREYFLCTYHCKELYFFWIL